MSDHVIISKEITGASKVYGIIGNPVTFSLSPLIHNTVSKYLGIDNVYVAFPVKDGKLKYALEGAHILGINGFNVTHPYKQDVIPLLTHVDSTALQIGAVNTLKYENEGYSGYNTDGYGLYASLVEHKVELENQNVVVLGAGGSARAVCMMAASKSPLKLYILNRTIENAKSLATQVKKHYNIDIEVLPMEQWGNLPNGCICFQTTSVGMGDAKEASPMDHNEFFKKLSVAVDLIYNPFKTLFLKNAEKNGAYTINGFGMLFYQAIKSYEIWNDIKISNRDLRILFDKIQEEYIQMKG